MAALDILSWRSCPGDIDLSWHFCWMIYDMVLLSALVVSRAGLITLIFFGLLFIPACREKATEIPA